MGAGPRGLGGQVQDRILAKSSFSMSTVAKSPQEWIDDRPSRVFSMVVAFAVGATVSEVVMRRGQLRGSRIVQAERTGAKQAMGAIRLSEPSRTH